MKSIKHIYWTLILVSLTLSSCILEDQDPEYNIVGALGTISGLQVSNASPVEGETVNFDVTVYSEHEPASELRMNLVQGTEKTRLETITYTTWNTEDSYLETFSYTVPAGTSETSIVIEFEIVTRSDYARGRTTTLSVQ